MGIGDRYQNKYLEEIWVNVNKDGKESILIK